jgi:hypothetical protein
MSGVISNMQTYVINTWVPNRPEIFLNACVQEGMYTSAGPIFKINDQYQHGGAILAGDTLTITSTGRFHTAYYTLDGSDPRLQGLPQQDINTTTLVAESNVKRVLVPTGPISDDWKGGPPFAKEVRITKTSSRLMWET